MVLAYESRFTAEAPWTAEITQSGGVQLNLCVSSAIFGSSVVNLLSQCIPKGEISDETGFNISFDSSNDYLRRRVKIVIAVRKLWRKKWRPNRPTIRLTQHSTVSAILLWFGVHPVLADSDLDNQRRVNLRGALHRGFHNLACFFDLFLRDLEDQLVVNLQDHSRLQFFAA